MACDRLVRVAASFVLALVCASCGPHMVEQASIHTYQRRMPSMPSGTAPIGGREASLTLRQSKLPKSPLPATQANLEDGRVYYGYYCLMCHGEMGDGNGPVGVSYPVRPTDLSSTRVRGMSDGQLYYAMLHGLGHDPVMEETVLPEQRWALVIYLRTLAKSPQPKGM